MARLYPLYGPANAPILLVYGAAQFHRTNGYLEAPRRDKRENNERVFNAEVRGK